MHPLRRLGRAQAEQAPVKHLNRILLEVDQYEQQPIFRGRQGTVLIGRVASRLPTPSLQGPFGHGVQERGLKGGHQRGKLVHGSARQISYETAGEGAIGS